MKFPERPTLDVDNVFVSSISSLSVPIAGHSDVALEEGYI